MLHFEELLSAGGNTSDKRSIEVGDLEKHYKKHNTANWSNPNPTLTGFSEGVGATEQIKMGFLPFLVLGTFFGVLTSHFKLLHDSLAQPFTILRTLH